MKASVHYLNAIEGKYEILEKISEGGMGAVYKVRHRLLERIRVIKIMRPQLAADREMRSRFLREARLAGSLRHPNIAQVYDFAIEKEGEAFLVMEYVAGVTLQQILAHYGPPTPAWTLRVICQSLDALDYLHEKGVIHRDLSPDNIMVTRDDEGRPLAKLIDLGIAKLVESDHNLTAQGSFIGKVRYASPELFKTQEGAQVGVASDLYAMGLVLYEVLTGVHPMGENDVSGYIAAHLFKEPKSFDLSDPGGKVPLPVRESILKSLAKMPEDRQPGVGGFRQDLLQVLRTLEENPLETGMILECCARHAAQETPDTQERLDAQFEFGSPSGESTDIRALLEKAEPTALQGGHSPIAPTLSLQKSPEAPGDDQTRVLSTGRRQLGKRRKRMGLLLAFALIIIPLLIFGLFQLQHSPSTEKQLIVQRGTVLLDAQPWARVASIQSPDGSNIDLDVESVTPLRLTLAPGHYTATLTRDGESEKIELDVAPGAETRKMASFATIRPEDFLNSVGLHQP